MNDSKLTPKQKESISLSVLRGDGFITSENINSFPSDERNKLGNTIPRTSELVLQRHHNKGRAFLQVLSEKSNVEPMNKKFSSKPPPKPIPYPVFVSTNSVAVMRDENPAAGAIKNAKIAEAKRLHIHAHAS
jgi:hypothetical protein